MFYRALLLQKNWENPSTFDKSERKQRNSQRGKAASKLSVDGKSWGDGERNRMGRRKDLCKVGSRKSEHKWVYQHEQWLVGYKQIWRSGTGNCGPNRTGLLSLIPIAFSAHLCPAIFQIPHWVWPTSEVWQTQRVTNRPNFLFLYGHKSDWVEDHSNDLILT